MLAASAATIPLRKNATNPAQVQPELGNTSARETATVPSVFAHYTTTTTTATVPADAVSDFATSASASSVLAASAVAKSDTLEQQVRSKLQYLEAQYEITCFAPSELPAERRTDLQSEGCLMCLQNPYADCFSNLLTSSFTRSLSISLSFFLFLSQLWVA
jgi:hypothetical protein